MIPFDKIHSDIVPVLKEHGIKETDLFNHYSDLYVGCPDNKTAQAIKSAGTWKALSSVFTPQSGSEMDHYPVAVDIAFGAMAYAFETKNPKH